MKVLRETLFNRIFRKKRLRKQRQYYERVCKTLQRADDIKKALEKSSSLMTLLAIHKDMWGSGLRNKNIGPDSCGYFRTKDIATMKPEEVFLGNINGLLTYAIPEWEENRNAFLGENGFGTDPGTRIYDLILNQYRQHLLSNLLAIIKPEKDWLENFNNS